MDRRSFLGLLAAPAIIRVAGIMPIKALPSPDILDAMADCIIEMGRPIPIVYGRMKPYGMIQFIGDHAPTVQADYHAFVRRRLKEYGASLDT